jgi:hypothetical protein
MLSRRVATFLLGIWVGCCLFADALALGSSVAASRVLNQPQVAQARAAIDKAGEAAAGLLRHAVNEHVRVVIDGWEFAQLLLAALTVLLLGVAAQRKPLAVGVCVVMGAIAAVQHFFLTPELNSLGRQLDFPSEEAPLSLATRAWSLRQMYGGAEMVKLVLGGALASYLFVMESVVKRGHGRSRKRDSEEFASMPERLA